jgi:hypothetical protein
MSRRNTGNMHGEQYLADISMSKREVHDLDNEKPNCRIDEIIKAGMDKPFSVLDFAKRDGFNNCAHCIGDSTG